MGLPGRLAGQERRRRRHPRVVNRKWNRGYSPRLDAKGNSVRGIMACRELAAQLGLHAFEFTNVGSASCNRCSEGLARDHLYSSDTLFRIKLNDAWS